MSASHGIDGRPQWLWIGFLAAATVLLSIVFACAAPFAALAALGALVMPRRDGLYLMAVVWLSNQIVGFGLLNYPHTLDSYGWGLAIGIGALAAYLAARATVERNSNILPAITVIAAFLSAFVAYEAVLYGVSFVLGGESAFSAEIVARIALINGAALALLLAAHRVAVRFGLVGDTEDRIQSVTTV